MITTAAITMMATTTATMVPVDTRITCFRYDVPLALPWKGELKLRGPRQDGGQLTGAERRTLAATFDGSCRGTNELAAIAARVSQVPSERHTAQLGTPEPHTLLSSIA